MGVLFFSRLSLPEKGLGLVFVGGFSGQGGLAKYPSRTDLGLPAGLATHFFDDGLVEKCAFLVPLAGADSDAKDQGWQ